MKHLILSLVAVCAIWVAGHAQYTLTVEAAPAAIAANGTTYRFYVDVQDPTDQVSAIFGNNQGALIVDTPDGAFNSTFNTSWNASGLGAAFVAVFPEMADDTYATIGLEGPASESGIVGAADPSIVEDAGQPITPYFLTPGATNLLSNTITGASWYVLNTAANASPQGGDLRVFVMQVTTTGPITGMLNYQVFPLGNGQDNVRYLTPFDGAGTTTGEVLVQMPGCMDEDACNYDPEANLQPLGICEYIAEGECDCDGNVLDDCGECGGDNSSCATCTSPSACNYDENAIASDPSTCIFPTATCPCDDQGGIENDADGDGICDDLDDCVGVEDECGVCDGPGAILDCGCTDIPDGDCDCDGNQLDALGVCGGDCAEDVDADGICDDEDNCTDTMACNYNDSANEACAVEDCAGVCGGDAVEDAIGVCNGDCAADVDGDGICDDVDDCVGTLDACGICEGPGAIYECGCFDIPEGDCDCNGNQEDAIGECGGNCTEDADADGICDDVDDCVGELDACGICNGPGEIYECGCADIPDGDCDCDGNQEDALGVCGGDCTADEDADGICDDVDDCVGELDACGVCNGPGEIYECGCFDIPEGDCDCDGNQLDALNECGGDCLEDTDGDGVCDTFIVEGCMDSTACNYDADANTDDDSCTYPGSACDDGDALTVNDTLNVDCICVGDSAIFGCTNMMACNFDMNANADDGSCLIIGEMCDDGDSLTVNDVVLESCICLGDSAIFGCMDSTACNYDMGVNVEDGSCTYPFDSCDDGNELTENDSLNIDCICVGDTIDTTDFVFDFERLAFGMFPNPTTGEVTLRVDGFHTGVTMQVMDGAGRVVWSEQNLSLQGNTVFDLSRLSAGTYNVMLSDERGVSVKRLAIQK